MVKFICTTQSEELLGRHGPSGKFYVSHKGYPFIVDNSQDIDYFRNQPQRFQEVNPFKAAPKVEKYKSEDDNFKDFFKKKVKKSTVAKLQDAYNDLKTLIESVLSGDNLPEYVSDTDRKKVITLIKKQNKKDEKILTGGIKK